MIYHTYRFHIRFGLSDDNMANIHLLHKLVLLNQCDNHNVHLADISLPFQEENKNYLKLQYSKIPEFANVFVYKKIGHKRIHLWKQNRQHIN